MSIIFNSIDEDTQEDVEQNVSTEISASFEENSANFIEALSNIGVASTALASIQNSLSHYKASYLAAVTCIVTGNREGVLHAEKSMQGAAQLLRDYLYIFEKQAANITTGIQQ